MATCPFCGSSTERLTCERCGTTTPPDTTPQYHYNSLGIQKGHADTLKLMRTDDAASQRREFRGE
jgi:hypothetical protein